MSDPVAPEASSFAAQEASRGSAVRLGAEVLSRGLTFAATILMAHALRVADFGWFAAQSGIASILAEAGDQGLQALTARGLVAGHFTLGDFLKARAILLALCAVPATILIVQLPVLGILVVYFLLANWTEFIGVALRARHAPVLEGWLLFALRLFGLVGVALALRDPGLEALALGFAASTLPAVALGFVLLSRTRPSGSSVARRGARAVLRAAFPLGVNGPLALLSTKVELLALPFLRGAADAGLFAGALRLVEPLLAVPAAIAAGALPSLTRESLRGGDAARRRTALTVAILGIPAAAGLFLTAPGLIRLLGASFDAGAPALRYLGLAVVPLFFNTFLLQCLIAAGHASWVPRLTALRVGVASVLAALLLPRFGAVGAALGFLASESILCVLNTVACKRSGFGVSLAKPLAVGAALTAPMAVAVALLGGNLALLGTISLALVVFGATLALGWPFKERVLR